MQCLTGVGGVKIMSLKLKPLLRYPDSKRAHSATRIAEEKHCGSPEQTRRVTAMRMCRDKRAHSATRIAEEKHCGSPEQTRRVTAMRMCRK
ncbi:hypothetical protein NDU88_000978 [Pleurodeles waltl]|uniref:Uncharacterized protein n=1 Tax=Pleurodeles waltl TaxID=8319 RepID=A0AAV7THU9_PLEWA|nr:hypothetical protein NDU88_000978 [Pleurodeles waltl]